VAPSTINASDSTTIRVGENPKRIVFRLSII
jgi:hypothetical protein